MRERLLWLTWFEEWYLTLEFICNNTLNGFRCTGAMYNTNHLAVACVLRHKIYIYIYAYPHERNDQHIHLLRKTISYNLKNRKDDTQTRELFFTKILDYQYQNQAIHCHNNSHFLLIMQGILEKVVFTSNFVDGWV